MVTLPSNLQLLNSALPCKTKVTAFVNFNPFKMILGLSFHPCIFPSDSVQRIVSEKNIGFV